MARIWTCGWETGDAAKEPGSASGLGGNISSSIKRSGIYSATHTNAGNVYSFGAGGFSTSNGHYVRVYVQFTSWPTSGAHYTLTLGGRLRVYFSTDGSNIFLADNTGATLSSGTVNLLLDTWYKIDIELDQRTGAHRYALYVDGALIGSVYTTALTAAASSQFVIESQSVGCTVHFDDAAYNDSTGSAPHNTIPTAGSVVHLYPNGAGDADTGSPTRGGADSGTIQGQIDETTPNDATDYVVLPANPSDFWVDVDASNDKGIGASDAVTLVEVHGRLSLAASNTGNWFPQIQSQSAGTKVAGTTTTIALNSWYTNDDTSDLKQAKLRQLTDPQAGGAWTTALLDSMQISARTTDGNPDTWVSTAWALVEYVPAVVLDPKPFVMPVLMQAVQRGAVR
jgi:hypothetical protein